MNSNLPLKVMLQNSYNAQKQSYTEAIKLNDFSLTVHTYVTNPTDAQYTYVFSQIMKMKVRTYSFSALVLRPKTCDNKLILMVHIRAYQLYM